ncbi:hypothetical protein L6164_019766 [Bauhinia variegata]|uniref:Uncharacterized protein n=1 Tax=Bauhinia variegata TaxID=167791 RepID=A0ACB9MUH4_BAUVA|nr:hypothetical protein L6164_019766 [Bauhinia variegata]
MRKEVVALASVSTTVTVVALAALARRLKQRKEEELRQIREIVHKFASECATPVAKLWQIADDFVSDMKASLVASSNGSTTLNMLVSYAESLPSGEEQGFYYGVNLRGNDFLILCARLRGKSKPISHLHREEISIPDNLLAASSSSQELVEFIAMEVAKFVGANAEYENEHPKDQKLGFTVSYPVDESAASSGNAIKWKNFYADDPVGKRLVDEFNEALQKHDLSIRVDSSVGDLWGGRYYSRDSVAAVTLGMSTNASYVEAAQHVSRWHGQSSNSSDLVISTEWGNFKSSHLPVTQFDASLDAESSNPGTGIFGKLISGMYLGEIVRRVLLTMAQETALFGRNVPPKLMIPYQLRSPDMAAMHQDTTEDREIVSEKLEEVFGIKNSSRVAREVVAEVCDVVTERGARLAGAGIVGILKKLERIESKRSVVTLEGGLYDHYRIFRNYLHSSVWEMLGNDLSDNVVIDHSHGGSGTGALFLAASQSQRTGSS